MTRRNVDVVHDMVERVAQRADNVYDLPDSIRPNQKIRELADIVKQLASSMIILTGVVSDIDKHLNVRR